MPSPTAAVAAALSAGLLLGACTSGAATDARGGSSPMQSRTAAAGTTGSTSPRTSAPSSPSATTTAPAVKPDPASIPALIAMRYDAGNLRLGPEDGSTDAYRQYFVT